MDELKKRLNESNIVIAPDRFTASVERGIITTLGLESTFGINVMSFTRLANKLVGKDIKKCLTPEGSVMLISKVISEKQSGFEFYGNVAHLDGFANELYAALTAIRNSGISTEALTANLDRMTPQMRAKTRDIVSVYGGYLDALAGRHSDSSTRLCALAEFIENHPESVATTNFYCTDIYEFSAPELEIMAGLAKHALSLTVGLVSGKGNPNERIYPDRTINKLRSACRDRVVEERRDVVLPAPIDAISKCLFSYGAVRERVENGGKVSLRSAKDRHDETLSLALDIVDKVRKGGRYKDVEVYLSDMADYESEIKAVFSRYDIPFFIDKKELLAEQTKVRYILDALACVRCKFRQREVLDFVKNPLFAHGLACGEDDVFKFENYVLKYNVDRTRFFGEFALKNDVGRSGVSEQENAVPETVRVALIKALAPFTADLKSISDFVNASRKFLENCDGAWRAHVEKLTELSAYYVKCAEQVDSKLDDVLSEIDDVLSGDADIAEFENIFKSMLKTLKIALVPTFLDCVFVGDRDSRFMGEGDIYILGATNDKLPAISSGGAVVSPKDEEYLSSLGIDISPNEKQKLMTNKYAVCDLMKKPCGKLVVSYPETGSAGALRPSSVVAELQGLLSENGGALEVERISFDSLTRKGEDRNALVSKLFATEKSCFYEYLENVASKRAPLEDGATYGVAYECMSESDRERTDRMFDSPERIDLPDGAYFEGSTSVSRLENFFTCPYAHYFNYVLSLKKRKDGSAEGTENGTVLHYILEKFFKDVRDGAISDRKDIKDKCHIYFDRAIAEYKFEVLLEKPDTRRQLLRVKREGVRVCEDLYDICLRSQFKPALLEAKFGENGLKPMTLNVGDRKIALKGTIDRVDILDGNFVIVDYKTFKSADLKLDELYYGEKIQLYIYMKAVEDSLKLAPKGVFYLPIYAGFTDDKTSRYKFKGQVTDSSEVMGQMDSLFIDDPQKSVVPFKANSKGQLNGDVHLTRAEFDMLGDYAVRLATDGAKQIASGYIKPAPVKDACNRCKFTEICAHREKCVRRMSKITKESFKVEEDRSYDLAEENGGAQ